MLLFLINGMAGMSGVIRDAIVTSPSTLVALEYCTFACIGP